MGKVVIIAVKKDFIQSATSLQFCADHQIYVESSIHGIVQLSSSGEQASNVQFDTTNAFNNLNKNVLLDKIKINCSFIVTHHQPICLSENKKN